MVAVAAFPEIQDLAFTCPRIGPKVYITTGPSGWPETFVRKILDAELATFVETSAATVTVDELVRLFVMQRELKATPTDWFTIMGFMGRVFDVSPKRIPHTVGIAFWGQVVLAALAAGAN